MKACPEPAEGMKDEGVQVECYSGHTYAQEPRAFTWQGQRVEVERVEQALRTPRGPVFRVRTVDGRRVTLAYDEAGDRWAITQASASHQVLTN